MKLFSVVAMRSRMWFLGWFRRAPCAATGRNYGGRVEGCQVIRVNMLIPQNWGINYPLNFKTIENYRGFEHSLRFRKPHRLFFLNKKKRDVFFVFCQDWQR